MNAPDIEVHSRDALLLLSFQYFEENSLNPRSHQVQRISAMRDRLRASGHRGRCSAPPA